MTSTDRVRAWRAARAKLGKCTTCGRYKPVKKRNTCKRCLITKRGKAVITSEQT